jgi:hypothetical protein
MLSANYTSSYYDPGIFYKWTNNKFVLVIIYVDDIFGCGNDADGIAELKTIIGHTFDYTNLGGIGLYLGMRIDRSEKQIILHQQDYVAEIAADFSRDDLRDEKSRDQWSQIR